MVTPDNNTLPLLLATKMALLVDNWYLGVPNTKHKIQPISLHWWYMCQSLT